jgi:hypothetical protein
MRFAGDMGASIPPTAALEMSDKMPSLNRTKRDAFIVWRAGLKVRSRLIPARNHRAAPN